MTSIAGLGWWLPGAAYVVLFALHRHLITPIETLLIGDQAMIASLMFLPAGIKLISYYLFRFKCLPSLVAGIFVAHALMYQSDEGHALAALVGAMTSAAALPMLHFIASTLRIDLFRDYRLRPAHWTHLLGISGAAAVLSGMGFVFSWRLIDPTYADYSVIPVFVVGDTIGAFVLMFIAMLALKARRLSP